MPFQRPRTITLRQTDAAGVLFFAEQLALVHDVEEELFASVGFPVGVVLREHPFALPIVHAETDFLAPLVVGDVVTVALTVEHVGASSFVIGHVVTKDGRDAKVGAGKIVHVCIDKVTRQKTPLPSTLAERLRGIT
jgi:1,4-dihydroxy-2-naphthoyl-CoA hydrolase